MGSKCGSRQKNNIHNEEEKRETSKILLESSNSEVKTVIKHNLAFPIYFSSTVCYYVNHITGLPSVAFLNQILIS